MRGCLELLPADDWLPEIIGQVTKILVVLLADVLLQLAGRIPRNIPGHSPRFRVGAGIVDGGFVVQGTFVGPRVLLDDVHLVGMGMAEIIQPRSFIEPDDIDYECIALPMPDRVSEPGLAFDRFALVIWPPAHMD